MSDVRGITEIAQEAVEILAKAPNPEQIINQAKEGLRGILESTLYKRASREETRYFTEKANCGQWFIELHITLKYYRLIGPPNQKIYVWANDLLFRRQWKEFLQNIIRIGTGIVDKPTMPIYQVVIDESAPIKNGCEKLVYSEALELYSDTKNLTAGWYTRHPANKKALTPIENYFTNLALDRDNECAVLIGKMGAKSLHISRIDKNNVKNNTSAGVGIDGVSTVKHDGPIAVEIGASLLKELESFMDFKVTFTDNPIDFSPDILKKSVWFKNDPEMNGLLELRSSRRVEEWDYTAGTSSAFNFDFEAAARILGFLKADFRNEYKKATNTYRRFHVVF